MGAAAAKPFLIAVAIISAILVLFIVISVIGNNQNNNERPPPITPPLPLCSDISLTELEDLSDTDICVILGAEAYRYDLEKQRIYSVKPVRFDVMCSSSFCENFDEKENECLDMDTTAYDICLEDTDPREVCKGQARPVGRIGQRLYYLVGKATSELIDQCAN